MPESRPGQSETSALTKLVTRLLARPRRQRRIIVVCAAVLTGIANAVAARVWHWDETTVFIVGAVCAAFLGLFGTPYAVLDDEPPLPPQAEGEES